MSAAFAYFGWPAFIVACWILAYIVVFRPMLKKIAATTGTTDILKAPEVPLGKKVMISLDGSKTLIASFAVSLFAAMKALLDVLSQSTDVLDDIKTNFPWSTYFDADTVLKIISFAMLLVGVLHIWGKLSAARLASQP